MFIKRKLGWPLLLFFSFSPLLFWGIAVLPLSYRFYDAFSTFESLGEMAGLVGITMFSLSLVLSARMEIFEDFFGGMNRVYIVHHILGGTAFIFLLVHPLLLAFSRITISWKTAAQFLLPGTDWAINLGMTALLCMISLLFITFFVKLPYQLWRFTHKFMGAVFLLGATHSFFVSNAFQKFKPLEYYMFFIFGLGLLAYFYRTLAGRFLVRRHKYSVTNVTMVNPMVTQVDMMPVVKPINVVPGQFIFLYFISSGVSNETHPFSVSTVSPDGKISISAKSSGDYTQTLKNIKVGDIATIEGGFGRFNYALYKNFNQIWIAGGIGITPFLSMAQHLNDPQYHITLYYSVSTPDEAVYLPELLQLSQANPHLQVIPFYTKTMGRLSAEIIAKQLGDITKFDFFLCGPPPMMKSMRNQLKTFKIKETKIHSEEFAIC